MSAWEGMAQAAHNHLRACLHEGGGPQVGKVTWGALPHLQMPHLRDLQGGQMPRSSRGGGGGVGSSWNWLVEKKKVAQVFTDEECKIKLNLTSETELFWARRFWP